jgi:hypothetical protein
MKRRFDQYFFVVRRELHRVTGIEIFECITVDIEGSFKVRCSNESRAFSVRISQDGAATISEVSCKERPYFSFAWHEEKYTCDDSLALYESVSQVTDAWALLSWLGQKL